MPAKEQTEAETAPEIKGRLRALITDWQEKAAGLALVPGREGELMEGMSIAEARGGDCRLQAAGESALPPLQYGSSVVALRVWLKLGCP